MPHLKKKDSADFQRRTSKQFISTFQTPLLMYLGLQFVHPWLLGQPFLGPSYFLLRLSDCILETCNAVGWGESPWALVTPVKAIRVGVAICLGLDGMLTNCYGWRPKCYARVKGSMSIGDIGGVGLSFALRPFCSYLNTKSLSVILFWT